MRHPCSGCWWLEGPQCYVGDPPRDDTGRSLVKAEARCDSFTSKREMLTQVIPDDMLIITSERQAKAEGETDD